MDVLFPIVGLNCKFRRGVRRKRKKVWDVLFDGRGSLTRPVWTGGDAEPKIIRKMGIRWMKRG